MQKGFSGLEKGRLTNGLKERACSCRERGEIDRQGGPQRTWTSIFSQPPVGWFSHRTQSDNRGAGGG